MLLNMTVDINCTNKHGNTPLHQACLSKGWKSSNTVKLLLRKGASVDSINKDGNTALHIASENGSTKVVKTLLKHRTINKLTENENKRTALHLAAGNNHTDIACLLLGKPLPKQDDAYNSESEDEFYFDIEDDASSESEDEFGSDIEDDASSESEDEFGSDIEDDASSETEDEFGSDIEDDASSETEDGSRNYSTVPPVPLIQTSTDQGTSVMTSDEYDTMIETPGLHLLADMAGNGETSVPLIDRAGGSTSYAPYMDPNSPVNAEKNETMHMTLHTHSDVSTINTSTVTDTMQNSISIPAPTFTERIQPIPEIMSRSINQEYHLGMFNFRNTNDEQQSMMFNPYSPSTTQLHVPAMFQTSVLHQNRTTNINFISLENPGLDSYPNSTVSNPRIHSQSNSTVGNPSFHSQSNSTVGNPSFHIQSNSTVGNPGFHIQSNSTAGNPGFHMQSNSTAGNPGFHIQSNSTVGKPRIHIQSNSTVGNPGFHNQLNSTVGNPRLNINDNTTFTQDLSQNAPPSPPVEDVTDVSDNEELLQNYVQPVRAVLSDEPPDTLCELSMELDSTKNKEPAATIDHSQVAQLMQIDVGSSATPSNFQVEQSCQTRISLSQHPGTSKQEKIVKPHECEQCGKMFSSKLMLEAHVKRHSDSVGGKCGECQKEFKHKKNLSRHMRTHHSPEMSTFQCDKCPKKFKTKDTLTHHIKYVHDNVERFTCERCGKSYKRRKDLFSHKRLKKH